MCPCFHCRLAALTLDEQEGPQLSPADAVGSALAPPWGSGLELSPFRARKPLLPQPVLLPVRLLRLLPACPGLLSAGGVLSARTKLLEPGLRLLLRLLSSAKATGAGPTQDRALKVARWRPSAWRRAGQFLRRSLDNGSLRSRSNAVSGWKPDRLAPTTALLSKRDAARKQAVAARGVPMPRRLT